MYSTSKCMESGTTINRGNENLFDDASFLPFPRFQRTSDRRRIQESWVYHWLLLDGYNMKEQRTVKYWGCNSKNPMVLWIESYRSRILRVLLSEFFLLVSSSVFFFIKQIIHEEESNRWNSIEPENHEQDIINLVRKWKWDSFFGTVVCWCPKNGLRLTALQSLSLSSSLRNQHKVIDYRRPAAIFLSFSFGCWIGYLLTGT